MELKLETASFTDSFKPYVSSPLRSLLPSQLLRLSKFHTMSTITPVYTYTCPHLKLRSVYKGEHEGFLSL